MTIVGNIVNLSGRRKAKADPARAAVETHWRAIGGTRAVPRRDDIDPSYMIEALDSILLIERIAPRQARIRIAGQRVSDLLGMDLRGMPLSCLIAPPSRSWLGDSIETLFDGPAVVELGLAGPRGTLRTRPTAELVMLPLTDKSGAVTRALCYAGLPRKHPVAPMRLDISGERHTEMALPEPEPAPAAVPEVPAEPDFARADRAREAIRRRGRLHVVQN